MEYAFNVYNKFAADGAAMSVQKFLSAAWQRRQEREQTDGAGTRLTGLNSSPVVVCVGSDLAIGDCLGPITGSMLKRKTQGLSTFIYGTLSAPVTAKEIRYMRKFLKETHPKTPVIAVDAAVGGEGDIGLIKISDSPLRPGAGANKNLGTVGDLSVMGIVAEKSVANYALLNQTRLNLVYKMSEIISDALANLLYEKRV
ncbi:MAG: spore protease YyaC [Clostridia bacterium]|nr:spore protease YyaC [Clostridia bacterium]